ncbi:MAG: hypothetical protein QOF02_1670 [Blastocatellia bacterium]|jgi:hypothetical protein|nr:hypothetical protein [Blastocatellia bacterium]
MPGLGRGLGRGALQFCARFVIIHNLKMEMND